MQCEGFKKESNEYIEKLQDDSLPHISHGATQEATGHGYEASLEANTQSNKDKRPMEAPMVPSSSSMPVTTRPVAPLSMVSTPSSLAHTTSFVAESSLGRDAWERRPITRSVGKSLQIFFENENCLFYSSMSLPL